MDDKKKILEYQRRKKIENIEWAIKYHSEKVQENKNKLKILNATKPNYE